MRKIIYENRAGLLAAFIGICLILAGSILGEPAIIFKKAVVICLECIGIG